MSQSRQLAAIMFTDIVGYTALMGNDEKNALLILNQNRQIQKPIIEEFKGRFIKELGDGTLASFNTVSDAVHAAIKIQKACHSAKVFQLRIGIHLGEVVFENDDVFGDGVNIASRIQAVAEPGSIYISESVYNNISNKPGIITSYVKQEMLKNVAEPVKIYSVLMEDVMHGKENESKQSATSENSIAILSFVNMSNDPEQEYFSDGISEEIINVLAQLPNLKVAGRTSAFSFKGKHEDLRSIGKKLSVHHILEGSVRSSGVRIRITAQLIDVQSGYHLWSEKYDRVLKDVFEVQDEIARTIVEKLEISLGGKLVETKSREQTQKVEAYKHYLKGRDLVYKRGAYLFEALHHFQRALEIDSKYALAYAGLADTYTILCYYGLAEPQQAWPKAIENAKQALKYGPELAESNNCNAAVSMHHDWDWVKSKQQYLKALELNPGYEQARIWYGLFYQQMAFLKEEDAILSLRTALQTNPLSFYSYINLGLALGMAGQFTEGLEKAKRAVEIEPNSYLTQFFLSLVYDWAGQYDEALQTIEIALKMSNRHAWSLSMLTAFYVKWSNKQKALEIYKELIGQTGQKYIQPAILALAAAAIGDDRAAIIFAEQAFVDHDPTILFVKELPNAKALRAIAGFDDILKRMGL